MSVSPSRLQRKIPENPSNPSWPFEGFGWPMILCGAIGDYSYPEHLGPLSINFCFHGVLAAATSRKEYNSDGSSFCVVNRNKPTRICTLTSRRASQIAFFYSGGFLARFISETSVEIEAGIDADPTIFFSSQHNRQLLALPDCTLPLFGELERFVRDCSRRLESDAITDSEVEEMHAELLVLLCQRYRLGPHWFMNLEEDASLEEMELRHRLELSLAQIVADPITTKSLDTRAQEAGLSKFRYLRSFKNRFGVTPGQFVVLKKMELARVLLRSRKFPVEDIAARLGYRSWSNFALVFRKQVGITPKEYQLLSFSREQRSRAAKKVRHLL